MSGALDYLAIVTAERDALRARVAKLERVVAAARPVGGHSIGARSLSQASRNIREALAALDSGVAP
jgi:hypothetical protein